jgi:large conductance mechanosensitive channel
VGIIVGGAFGKIVNSLVNDIIMPPIGMLLRGVDFANIFWVLKRGKKIAITKAKYKSLTQAKEDGSVTINIGVFLNSLINFLVLSVIIFTLVRFINKLKRKKQKKSSKECKYCYSKVDIRAIRCPYCTGDLAECVPLSLSSSTSGNALLPVNENPLSAPTTPTYPDFQNILDVEDLSDDDDDDDHEDTNKIQSKYWKKNLKKQLSRTFN